MQIGTKRSTNPVAAAEDAIAMTDDRIIAIMTRGIAERPAQNGLSRILTLEEKSPRVQTKHRLDAIAAVEALVRHGFRIVADE